MSILLQLLTLWLLSTLICCRHYCPPPNFKSSASSPRDGLRTALISEIHGNVWLAQLFLGANQSEALHYAEYYNGDLLSRYLYHHLGVMGVDELHLMVLYNKTLHWDAPPTVEDIYPAEKYCVSDWFKTGAFGWHPMAYGGPKELWIKRRNGEPTLDRDIYKSKGLHDIYEEVKNRTDWVFVQDTDEYVLPVNFEGRRAGWCSRQQPSVVSSALTQMTGLVRTIRLDHYNALWPKNITFPPEEYCPLGHSHKQLYRPVYKHVCQPMTAFMLPVYIWTNPNQDYSTDLIRMRTMHPTNYSQWAGLTDTMGNHQHWKSVHQTRYNPPLKGYCMHRNFGPEVFGVFAPRRYHGVLSLELAHIRQENFKGFAQFLVEDTRMVDLFREYESCTL